MKKLDPRIIIVFFIKNFLSTVYIIPIFFIIGYLYVKILPDTTGIVPKDVLIFLLYGSAIINFTLLIFGCYYWSWLTFNSFNYDLQPDGIHINTGVFLKKHVLVPYNDIESVEILMNPIIVRFLELYGVRVRSREVVNTEGVLRKKQTVVILGLTADEATHLRPELLKYSHTFKIEKNPFNPMIGK